MSTKLNLGCGFDHKDGWINVDSVAACNPDVLCNLEHTPWPFDDDSADEVLMSHVLEHLGKDSGTYLAIIQELYRVCADGATVTIAVPHPRHDDFLLDPTHVRPILAESFLLFSKETCERLREQGAGDTPLALILDVDFKIEKIDHRLDPVWREKMLANEITQDDVADAARSFNNVVKESTVVLRVLKSPA